eukprot:COSAG06_NODE_2217_length_7324_cov_7.546298_1_plen_41_part_10
MSERMRAFERVSVYVCVCTCVRVRALVHLQHLQLRHTRPLC